MSAADATRATVWFRVNGQADLDHVGLGLVASSFMGNQGLETDERGRIPFWSEEKDGSLLQGRHAGQRRRRFWPAGWTTGRNSPLVCGAWARLAVELNQRGRTNAFLDSAFRLWNHYTRGVTNIGTPYLALSALELHAATGQDAYLHYLGDVKQ
jgi:hypothetical protein